MLAFWLCAVAVGTAAGISVAKRHGFIWAVLAFVGVGLTWPMTLAALAYRHYEQVEAEREEPQP